jgi:GntR family transcriptional regulator/MocR family aminotransferase
MRVSIQIDQTTGEPLQSQVFREIAKAIADGRLLAGERLAGTRSLSEELSVSRNTIINAYQRLIAEGYLETRRGGGTFIAASIPEDGIYASRINALRPTPVALSEGLAFGRSREATPEQANRVVCDFQLEACEASAFPQASWRRLVTRRMRSSKFNLTRSGERGGYPPLREAISVFLAASRGIEVSAERVLVVTGIQQALNVMAQLFVRPGTPVVMEAPCCGIARHLFENYGAKIVAIPVDRNGMRVEGLPEARGCLAFVTPTRQYPMGSALSRSRQDALIGWAERTDGHIVEVDFDGDFRYEGRPVPAMQTRDAYDRVTYVASFSSALGPGLRVGYMVLPPILFDAAADAEIFLEYGFPCSGFPWLEQAVLNDFIITGGYEKLLKRLRKLYKSRRNALIESIESSFGAQELSGRACGTHLIWRLPSELPDAAQVADIGVRAGVKAYTLAQASVGNANGLPDSNRVLLLGFAATGESEIRTGIALLAAALAARTPKSRGALA